MSGNVLGVVRISWIVVFVAVLFASSLVWLIRNWNAKGPTDLWKDEDLEGSRRKQTEDGEVYPGRPDPRRVQPLVLIGYWAADHDPDWPDPRRFVDAAWDRDERAMVVAHLQTGIAAPWTFTGYSTCRFCGAMNGSGEMTDGTFLWPEGLAHYLDVHDVRLPGVFVLHVKTSNATGRAPAELDPTRAQEIEHQIDSSWWESTLEP